MNNEFYNYTYQMQKYLESQNQRIAHLETELQALKKQVADLTERPHVNIERLEYKFDQLKVETLEGTLHIGLNPQDLNQMDELSVNGMVPGMNTAPFPGRKDLIQDIQADIVNDTDKMIQAAEQESGQPLDPSYQEFIKYDLARQLEGRIEMYMNKIPNTEHSSEQISSIKEKITSQLKNDIYHAIRQFITNTQTGGANPNGT
ncbi:spore germination protein GerPC [Peribacillus sp. SCS-155]|uniref:spore germination protein GerPC n=1 Tax=Peribacillus sedimenti TaxID=3115297 RepID=UPI003906841A